MIRFCTLQGTTTGHKIHLNKGRQIIKNDGGSKLLHGSIFKSFTQQSRYYTTNRTVKESALAAIALAKSKKGDNQGTLNILQKMEESGTKFSVVTLNSIINAVVMSGGKRAAFDALQMVDTSKITPTIKTMNLIMLAFAKSGDRHGIFAMWKRIENLGLRPDSASVSLIISTLVRAGDGAAALKILKDSQKVGLKPNESAMHSVLAFCASQGDAGLATKLFDEMVADMNGSITLAAYTHVINAHCKSSHIEGNVHKARNMYQRMRSDHPALYPDPRTASNLMMAHATAGDSHGAWEVLNDLISMGFSQKDPSLVNYCLSAHAQAGDGKGALQSLEQIQKRQLPIDSESYSAVLLACVRAGDIASVISVAVDAIKRKKYLTATQLNPILAILVSKNNVSEVMKLYGNMLKAKTVDCSPNATTLALVLEAQLRTSSVEGFIHTARAMLTQKPNSYLTEEVKKHNNAGKSATDCLDITVINTALQACRDILTKQLALGVLRRIIKDLHLRPNHQTANTILHVIVQNCQQNANDNIGDDENDFSQNAESEVGTHTAKYMTKASSMSLEQRKAVYTSTIIESLGFLKLMRLALRLQPDEETYHILLRACCAGDVYLLETANDENQNIDRSKSNLLGNDSNFVLPSDGLFITSKNRNTSTDSISEERLLESMNRKSDDSLTSISVDAPDKQARLWFDELIKNDVSLSKNSSVISALQKVLGNEVFNDYRSQNSIFFEKHSTKKTKVHT